MSDLSNVNQVVTAEDLTKKRNELIKFGTGDEFRFISHATIDNWVNFKDYKRIYEMNDTLKYLKDILQAAIAAVIDKDDMLEYYILLERVYAEENKDKENEEDRKLKFKDGLYMMLANHLGKKDTYNIWDKEELKDSSADVAALKADNEKLRSVINSIADLINSLSTQKQEESAEPKSDPFKDLDVPGLFDHVFGKLEGTEEEEE